MTRPSVSVWFPPGRPNAATAPPLDARAAQLFCLPHAGAGASAYRLWPELLAPAIEVIPVQLPGRESRRSEPLRRSVFDLAAELSGPLADRADGEFSLFGHSLGALLGYELAHALAAIGRPPAHLFVSGLSAPHLPPARPPTYNLPEDELMSVIEGLEGTTAEVLASAELMRLLLPVFRADLESCETYQHPSRPPLSVPITALGGRHDSGVSLDRLAGWSDLSSAAFCITTFAGGHFYLHSALAEVTAVVGAKLRSDRND